MRIEESAYKLFLLVMTILLIKAGYCQDKRKMVSFYFIEEPQYTDHIILSNSDDFWDYNHERLFAVVDTLNRISIFDVETYTNIHNNKIPTENIRGIKNPHLNGIFFFPNTRIIVNYYREGVSFDYYYRKNNNSSSVFINSNIIYSTYIRHRKYQGYVRCYMSKRYDDGHYRTLLIVSQFKNLYRMFEVLETGKGNASHKTYKKLPGGFHFYSAITKHPINNIKFNENSTLMGIAEDSIRLVLFDTKLEYEMIDTLSFNRDDKLVDFSINDNELTVLTETGIKYFVIEDNRIKLLNTVNHKVRDPVFLKRRIKKKLFARNKDYMLVGFLNEVHFYSDLEKQRTVKEKKCIYHDGFITGDMERFFMVKTKMLDN